MKRKRFQGVINILSFNRHFYFLGFGVLILLGFILWKFSDLSWLWLTAIMATIYGLTAPLLVSAYVYDFNNYYDLPWLNFISKSPKTLLNIHAGFDETSNIIQHKFQHGFLTTLDFYNPENHTEEAIKRAMKKSDKFVNTFKTKTTDIQFPDNSIDLICLFSTAHEIRNPQERIAFFKELKRILHPNGTILMSEHLRDLPNFLAFSVGFTHFHSKNTWIEAIQKSGLQINTETKFTPFISIFKIQKS